MDDKIKEAFGAVYAGEDLKSRTKEFIARKSHGFGDRRYSRRIIPAAAAVCLTLALFAGVKLYLTPTTRVNIDINPSLELGINRFDKVVSVEPLNDDGKKLAQTLDIKFADYNDAFRRILDEKSVKDLLSENEIMTVTVIETKNGQSANILSGMRDCANGYSNVYCHSASSEEAHAAREFGLSCGKYRAFLELRELDPDITPEDIQGMSMREIRELTAALSGNAPVNSESENHHDNSGGHHGSGHDH